MSEYKPPNANRLLELEQELLGQRRFAEMKKRRQNKQDALEKCEPTAEIPDDKLLKNNRLLALEQELLQQRRLANNSSKFSTVKTEEKTHAKKRKAPVNAQAFDTGEAIFLEYNASFYQPTSINSAQNSLSFHLQNDDYSFQVESFGTNNLKAGDGEERSLVQLNSQPNSSSPLKSTEPSVNSEISPLKRTLAIRQGIDLLADENSNTTSKLQEEHSSSSTSETSEIPETEAFLADIQAILKGEINHQPEMQSVEKLPEKALEQERQEPQKKNERHAIFDQMGVNMAFANSFDLGTVELEMQFDQFDRVLDEQEKQSNNPVSEDLQTRFDEFDRALDKAENPLPIPKVVSPILQELSVNNLAEQESIPEVVRLSCESENEPISGENEQQAIAFTECYAVEPSYANVNAPFQFRHQEATLLKRNASTNLKSSQPLPELNLGMRMLLLRSCLKFISQVLWLIKFLSQTEVSFQGLTPCLKMRPQPIEKIDDFIPSNLNSQTSILLLPAQKPSSQLNQRK